MCRVAEGKSEKTGIRGQRHPSEKLNGDVESNWPVMEAGVVC